MKNTALQIITILIGLQSFANDGEVFIKLKSSSDVLVYSNLKNINLESQPDGFYIQNAAIDTNELETKPGVAKGRMKSKKILDVKNYPKIYVTNLQCVSAMNDSASGACSGNLEIKGRNLPLANATYRIANDHVSIKFNFKLSDYNIAQKVFLFKINNSADVEVKIKL
jgi:hypothetical protein